MNIALFGGAFDPPHFGHLTIAQTLLEKGHADQVILMPAKNHPFGKKMASDQDRLEMLQVLFFPDQRTQQIRQQVLDQGACRLIVPAEQDATIAPIVLSTFEIDLNQNSFSYQTIKCLARAFPEHTFSWVLGSDSLAKFHLWGGDYKQFAAEYTIFVYPREGSAFEPLYGKMQPLHDYPVISVSSTAIRDRLAMRQPITDLTSTAVAAVIARRNV